MKELTHAVECGNAQAVEKCLLLGCDANTPMGKDGWPPLCCAVASGRIESVATLLAHRADPNQTVARGVGQGMVALDFCRDVPMAMALLQAGARLDSVDCRGWIPVQWATFMARHDVAAALLEVGSPPSSPQSNSHPKGSGPT